MIVWILEHHYALAGLFVAAVVASVSAVNLFLIFDQANEERRSAKLGGDGLERAPRGAGVAVAADTSSREWMVARSGSDEAA